MCNYVMYCFCFCFLFVCICFISFYFFWGGGGQIAPPSMAKGGPPCRWTRVHRKATAQPDATVPRPENGATTNQNKKTTRTHCHRLAPTWCGAREVSERGGHSYICISNMCKHYAYGCIHMHPYASEYMHV